MRLARSFAVAVMAVVLLLGGLSAPRAHAEPADSSVDKATIARQETTKACQSMPNLDGIDFKLFKIPNPDALNPRKTCEDVVYNQIMGTSSKTMLAQCEATLTALGGVTFPMLDKGYGWASGKGGMPVTEMCARNAQKVFTSTVAAVEAAIAKAKQLGGAVKCAVSEGLPCILRQFAEMQGSFVNGLWGSYFSVLTQPSAATSVLAVFKSDPQDRTPQQKAFASVYQLVGAVSASIILVMALISLLGAAIRGNLSELKHTLGGVAVWGFMWLGGIGLAAMVLFACDGLAVFFAGAPGPGGTSPIQDAGERIARFVQKSVEAQFLAGVMTPSGAVFATVVVGLILLLAIGAALVTLAFRDMSLILMGVVLPLLLAMQAGPAAMRAALPRWIAAFLAAAVAKPLMVLGLRLGSAFIAEPAAGTAGLFNVAMGTTMLVVVAFTPGVVYKLFNVMATQAGSHFGAGSPGRAQQSLHSLRSMSTTSSMTQSVLAANAPAPRSAGGGPASSLGAAGRSSGLGAAPKLAGAAGALGAVAVGAMLAAETAGSATKTAASLTSTAGGALGDAEKGHVPNPGYRSGGGSRGGGGGSTPSRPRSSTQVPSPQRQARPQVPPTPPQAGPMGAAPTQPRHGMPMPPRTENPRKG